MGRRLTGSDAECAFAVVHRALTHDGNPIEAGLPTFRARRFVDCSNGDIGLALVHDGLGEYEVVHEGQEPTLTLLRTVGFLSRDDGRLRPVGAGPPVAIPHAEQLGPFHRAYAIVLHRGGWEDARLYARAEDVLLPLEHTWVATTTGSAAERGGSLSVEGAEVTAVLRDGKAVVVRVFRASAEAGTVRIRWERARARAWLVNLRGHPLKAVEGEVHLKPWEIATLRLDTR